MSGEATGQSQVWTETYARVHTHTHHHMCIYQYSPAYAYTLTLCHGGNNSRPGGERIIWIKFAARVPIRGVAVGRGTVGKLLQKNKENRAAKSGWNPFIIWSVVLD